MTLIDDDYDEHESKKKGYLLGWSTSYYDNAKIYSHSGAYYFMTSYYVFVPDEEIGMVIYCNAEPETEKIEDKFLELFVGY